jgi:hypothetical protein
VYEFIANAERLKQRKRIVLLPSCWYPGTFACREPPHSYNTQLAAVLCTCHVDIAAVGCIDVQGTLRLNASFPVWCLAAAVLVHCGAGVSRSACMVMMYLMRSKMWSAQQARCALHATPAASTTATLELPAAAAAAVAWC